MKCRRHVIPKAMISASKSLDFFPKQDRNIHKFKNTQMRPKPIGEPRCRTVQATPPSLPRSPEKYRPRVGGEESALEQCWEAM